MSNDKGTWFGWEVSKVGPVEDKSVYDIAKELGRKPVEVALAWVLTRDNIFTAIVGSRKSEQVLEFAKSTELTLSPNQLQRLTSASDLFPMVKKGH